MDSRDDHGQKYKDVDQASHIYILPNLFTAGNLFFGFLAIIRCIQAKYADHIDITNAYYTQAVWCILFACICDALDGRVARLGGRESLFGKEFDSIADTVSFGVAPALMVFFLILSPSEESGYEFFRRINWLIGFIYLLCVGVRLARFNVITNPLIPGVDKILARNDFMGLPAPAAAGMIASLVLVMISLDVPRQWTFLLPPLMLLIAYLMVSNISYPSFKHIDWQTRTRMHTFIGLAAFIGLAFVFQKYVFAIAFFTYIFYGFFRHVRRKLNKTPPPASPTDPSTTL